MVVDDYEELKRELKRKQMRIDQLEKLLHDICEADECWIVERAKKLTDRKSVKNNILCDESRQIHDYHRTA